MNREAAIWLGLFLLGGLGILWQATMSPQGVGTVYVTALSTAVSPEANPPAGPQTAVHYQVSTKDAPGALFSLQRTIGVWVAAIFTLGALSYLYRDNPFYKIVESIVVGVSAGYWIVVGFWDNLVAKLFLRLWPALTHAWALPLGEGEQPTPVDYSYIVPLVLGILLFFRFLPKLEWLSTWPLAFVVGMTAGLKLIVFLEADFVDQISSTMLPLLVFTTDPANKASVFQLTESIKNLLFVFAVLSSLTYFYFSVEHRGAIQQVARCGVWVLMITFGSSFAFTVMGRITLLTVRMEFLLGQWLRLINVSG